MISEMNNVLVQNIPCLQSAAVATPASLASHGAPSHGKAEGSLVEIRWHTSMLTCYRYSDEWLQDNSGPDLIKRHRCGRRLSIWINGCASIFAWVTHRCTRCEGGLFSLVSHRGVLTLAFMIVGCTRKEEGTGGVCGAAHQEQWHGVFGVPQQTPQLDDSHDRHSDFTRKSYCYLAWDQKGKRKRIRTSQQAESQTWRPHSWLQYFCVGMQTWALAGLKEVYLLLSIITHNCIIVSKNENMQLKPEHTGYQSQKKIRNTI